MRHIQDQTIETREPSSGRHPRNFRAQRKDQLDTRDESALWTDDQMDAMASEWESREGYNLMVRFGMEVQA
jgi:hypothetical protein